MIAEAEPAPTRSAAFGDDGTFDESKLAKPSDWAALDDFDEEKIIAEMTKRVDETWMATKAEVQFEKTLHDTAKDVRTKTSPRPAPAPAPVVAAAAPSKINSDAATLALTFTNLSGGVVKLTADGRKVTQQSQLVLRKECEMEEIAFKTEVVAELKMGARQYSCKVKELVLDAGQEKQWKQVGSNKTGLRLQVRFVKKTSGASDAFHVADVRATIPAETAVEDLTQLD